MTGLAGVPVWPTLLLSLGLFCLPVDTLLILWVVREWRYLREERRRSQAEEEAMAAEGFPPPGPPTTDIEPPETVD